MFIYFKMSFSSSLSSLTFASTSLCFHITPSSLFSCSLYHLSSIFISITPPSLHHHSTITPPSLRHHHTITPPSLHHHSTITPPSPHHHSTTTPPPLHHHSTITPPSLHHHSTITTPFHTSSFHHLFIFSSPSHSISHHLKPSHTISFHLKPSLHHLNPPPHLTQAAHATYLDVEPQTGLLARASKKLQFNYLLTSQTFPTAAADSQEYAAALCANISEIVGEVNTILNLTANGTEPDYCKWWYCGACVCVCVCMFGAFKVPFQFLQPHSHPNQPYTFTPSLTLTHPPTP
jgi:hypothetical protein